MCVFCRKRFARSELTRFAARDSCAVMDENGTLPGRGAYCCRKCLPLADEDGKGLLKRALKIS